MFLDRSGTDAPLGRGRVRPRDVFTRCASGVDDDDVEPRQCVSEVRRATRGTRGHRPLHPVRRHARAAKESRAPRRRPRAGVTREHPELGPLVLVGPTGWGERRSSPTPSCSVTVVARTVARGLYRDAIGRRVRAAGRRLGTTAGRGATSRARASWRVPRRPASRTTPRSSLVNPLTLRPSPQGSSNGARAARRRERRASGGERAWPISRGATSRSTISAVGDEGRPRRLGSTATVAGAGRYIVELAASPSRARRRHDARDASRRHRAVEDLVTPTRRSPRSCPRARAARLAVRGLLLGAGRLPPARCDLWHGPHYTMPRRRLDAVAS